ncbi:hypothetical protein C8J57DRAFT_1324676 [Mycena rebaudengoi]|nr:hypothetical protein C8J57DRAFT_1324676 [Mycena rebaudengoi]
MWPLASRYLYFSPQSYRQVSVPGKSLALSTWGIRIVATKLGPIFKAHFHTHTATSAPPHRSDASIFGLGDLTTVITAFVRLRCVSSSAHSPLLLSSTFYPFLSTALMFPFRVVRILMTGPALQLANCAAASRSRQRRLRVSISETPRAADLTPLRSRISSAN